MNVSERERRLLIALVPALMITAFVYFWTEPSSSAAPVVTDTAAAIDIAQARLDRVRAIAAMVPPLQDLKQKTAAELALWDKRLVQADTAAQAQAQLLQIFRRVARLQGATVEIRSSDLGTVQPSNAYAEIALNVTVDCQVEGLLNLLTDIASQPEFLSWRDLRVSSPDSKQKRINVSLTLLALAPAKLIARPAGGNRG